MTLIKLVEFACSLELKMVFWYLRTCKERIVIHMYARLEMRLVLILVRYLSTLLWKVTLKNIVKFIFVGSV